MKNLHELRREGEAMRVARLREERCTMLFLAASTAVAGIVALVAIAMLFAAWPGGPIDASRAVPESSGLREGRYLDARR